MELPSWFTIVVPFFIPRLVSHLQNTPVTTIESILLFSAAFVSLRYLRLYIYELSLLAAARRRGATIPPHVPSSLPFGISNFLQRLKVLESGTPDTSLPALFDKTASSDGIAPKVVRLRTLGMEVYITSRHEDMQYMLASGFANWGKSQQFHQGFAELLGEGVFNTDQRGQWKWHRNLTRPHFARDRVADLGAIEEHWARANNWLALQSRAGRAVDIQDLFARFTLTAGTQHLFGKAVDSLNDLINDRKMDLDAPDASGFALNFHLAQLAGLKRMILPEWLQAIGAYLRGSDEPTQKVLAVVDKLIEQRLAENPRTDVNTGKNDGVKTDHDDLVSHLASETSDPKMIRHECVNILLAARDTTASLLTSVVFELARKPELWLRCRNEIVEAFGDGKNGLDRELGIDEVRSLKYLRAVLNESLRLHPPVWSNSRMAFEDDVLPSGYFIPKNTLCRYGIRMIQRDPALWGTDADEFVPERWIDDRRLVTAKDPFRFQPFSAGPRVCLGQQFAYTEASIAMIRLMQKFSNIQVTEKSLVGKEYPGVTSSFRDGMWVELTEKTE